MSISLNTPRRKLLRSLPILIVVLFTLSLAGCSAEIEETSAPISFYSDQEVEAFIALFPSLALEYSDERISEDILERLGIDTAVLQVIDRYVGDCLDFVGYDLSPSYELVVDDNACFGYHIYVRNK